MIIYSKSSIDRKENFRLITTIEEENKKLFVRKKAAYPSAKNFLFAMVENYEKLKNGLGPIKLAGVKLEKDSVVFPYIKGKTLSDEFKEYYFNGQGSKAIEILKEFKNILNPLPKIKFEAKQHKDFQKIFGDPTGEGSDWTVGCLDLNLDNLIRNGREIYLIDYEWVFDLPLPKKFLYLRTFIYTFFSIKELLKIRCSEQFPLVQLSPEIFVPKEVYDQESVAFRDVKRFFDYETNFQSYISLREKPQAKLQKSIIYESDQRPNVFLKINKLEESVRQLERTLQSKESELKGVYESRSWRLTSSLRKIRDSWKRLNKKPIF